MGSKIILVWPAILLAITAIVAVLLYLYHDNTVKFTSSWAWASYAGIGLSGLAFGITSYIAFQKKSPFIETPVTSPISVSIN